MKKGCGPRNLGSPVKMGCGSPMKKACWDNYEMVGMKKNDKGRMVPNCVPEKNVKKDKKARLRAASLGDLTEFLKVAEGTLIHKSTKDLWSFKKDADGMLQVERLFDDNGKPLKA